MLSVQSIQTHFSFSTTHSYPGLTSGTIYSQMTIWKTLLLTLINIWLGGKLNQILVNIVMFMAKTSEDGAFKILSTPYGLVSGHLLPMFAPSGLEVSTTATLSINKLARKLIAHTVTCLNLTELILTEPLLN